MSPMDANPNWMEEQWRLLEKQVLTDATPPYQRRDVKRAFFAGADLVMRKLAEPVRAKRAPTASDLESIILLERELKLFARSIREE